MGGVCVQGTDQIFPVGQRDIAPHLRRTGGNARGVTKARRAQAQLGLRAGGGQDQIHQGRGDDVRQMTGTTDEQIMLCWIQPQDVYKRQSLSSTTSP